MNLQAKLTLWNILLVVVIVVTISGVDLIGNMGQQFKSTLRRAEILRYVAGKAVERTVNKPPARPLREALHDPDLQQELIELVANEKTFVEIAVVDPKTNEVLADSIPEKLGQQAGAHRDFSELVANPSWWDKALIVLGGSSRKLYDLERLFGSSHGSSPEEPVLAVRVIIKPWLISSDIGPILTSNALTALICAIAAIVVTFLFSAVAFRPLRQLGRQLDLIASGEYEPEKNAAAKRAMDEFALISSKVSMLGERLRGAQFEVSDLRGNIERVLQDLEDAVFVFNREMRLVFASGSVEKFLGKEPSDFVGQTIGDVFPPSTTLGLLVAQASQTGRPIRNRRVPFVANGDGSAAVVMLSVDPLEALQAAPAATSGLLVRLRDPEAQRNLGRQLQTADRLAAISKISSGVAHEVKNPLNAIGLHVEVVRAKLSRGQTDVTQEMEIISREILRLDRVVKTFLDFTRPVELRLANVLLQDLVREIVELARPQAEASKIRVVVEDPAEHVELRVDRDLMKQAVLNVVVNAIEAMPEGGELRFSAMAGEDSAEIFISDTGHGIAPELREKIFRLYFTTRKEGSGIGLAMTFRIVQLHDGTIDFSSEPGKGTTFFIRLPVVA
jgi:signal transduction histidine kinase